MVRKELSLLGGGEVEVFPVTSEPEPERRLGCEFAKGEARGGYERKQLHGHNIATEVLRRISSFHASSTKAPKDATIIAPLGLPVLAEEVHLSQADDDVERRWKKGPPLVQRRLSIRLCALPRPTYNLNTT